MVEGLGKYIKTSVEKLEWKQADLNWCDVQRHAHQIQGKQLFIVPLQVYGFSHNKKTIAFWFCKLENKNFFKISKKTD